MLNNKSIDLIALEKKLNYKFKNSNLALLALRHRSLGDYNNERLEFLGDAILELIISQELFLKFNSLNEGELTRLRANLVKKSTLAFIAKQNLKLDDFLQLGIGELKSGGQNRASILADAFEALIAAIYLDNQNNIEICSKVVLNWYKDKFNEINQVDINTLKVAKDPKTELQELMQAGKYSLPLYTIKLIKPVTANPNNSNSSDLLVEEEQIFVIECYLAGLELYFTGEGSSKRQAEQAAARLALDHFNQNK